ncbi:MAG: STAS domain-containing protein [Planctomycetes bacterium]|nr:STAS domain-containing protein [Planctomycetota bacterium]
MDIHVTPIEAGIQVRVDGDLVAGACPTFRQQVEGAAGGLDQPVIVLQLDGVAYMDSCGLGTLIFIDRFAAERGGRLFLLRVPPLIRRFLQLTGLGEKFNLIQDLAEARPTETRP